MTSPEESAPPGQTAGWCGRLVPLLASSLFAVIMTAGCATRAGNAASVGSSLRNSASHQDREQIRRDVLAVVGGNFSVAALGPEEYRRIRSRIESRARDALQEFESLFLGENFDPITQSRLHLPSFLALTAPFEPQLARTFARQLQRHYDTVLVIYDAAANKDALLALLPEATANAVQRLVQRRAEIVEQLR